MNEEIGLMLSEKLGEKFQEDPLKLQDFLSLQSHSLYSSIHSLIAKEADKEEDKEGEDKMQVDE